MFKNYAKIALRNILKHKGISSINIFGLALGMTCAILILLWVQQQLAYDQWQENKENLYRLESESWVVMPPYLRETATNFPEVEEAVRFYYWWEPVAKYNETSFTIENFALVDSNVFRAFTFNFITGDPKTALINPYSIVLTETIADKLFGNESALGKTIQLNNRYDYKVTGVVADIEKLHMDINAFVSVNDITRIDGNPDFLTARSYNFSIYLLANASSDIPDLVEKLNKRAVDVDQWSGDPLILRPFNSIYFEQNLSHEKNTKHGNINMVIVFSVIAILILVIACINFINLTIAKTGTRVKEIAIRKVSGAEKNMLKRQFFGETSVVVVISFIFSVIFIYSLLPNFSNLTGENLALNELNISSICIIAGVLFFTILVSGIYPSLYLSALEPAKILKGDSGKRGKNAVLSKTLLSFQFAISTFLIICTVTVISQLRYMQTKDLGMDHEEVLVVSVKGEQFRGEAQHRLDSKKAFVARLQTNPAIIDATFLSQLPGKITNTSTMHTLNEENRIPVRFINTDPAFKELFGIELVEGRFQSFEHPSDLNNTAVINEEAVRQWGLENPIGQMIGGDRFKIIGVVKDFHFNSLHKKIVPMGIRWNSFPGRACIKFKSNNVAGVIEHVKNVFNEFCPGYPFEYNFLDESFAREYVADQKLEEILTYFVSIAIILSCLGLFALTAFIAEQKTKEIGIRKVLGSTVTAIVLLLTNYFTKWIIIATVVAWPLAYLVLNKWLQGFAYHIEIGFSIFIVSALLAFAVALLTIAYQAIKAALANPIKALKYE